MDRVFRLLNRQAIVFITFCLTCSSFAAAQTALDLDQDGASDFLGRKVATNGSNQLDWFSRSSATSRVVALGTFGSQADLLVPGHWVSPTTTSLAVIRRDGDKRRVTWHLGDGTTTLSFGEINSTFLTGGDFNGNLISDAARIQNREGKLFWRIYKDPFTTAGALGTDQEFGISGDRPFFYSMDGSRDVFAVIRANSVGGDILTFDPQTGSQSTTFIPKSLMRFRTPLPLKDRKGADSLLFSRVVKGNTSLRLTRANGKTEWTGEVEGHGTILVGEFVPSWPGEEVAVQVGRKVQILNPFNRRKKALNMRIGTPISETLIQSFATKEQTPSTPTSPSSIGNCTALEAPDGAGGFIWKPNSDTTYYAVAVLPGRYRGKINSVEIFSGTANKIKDLAYTGCGNPDAEGDRCNYKDFSLTGAEYRRRYGSIYIKLNLKNGRCASYYLSDPSKRID